ncbi:methyl-accepting chemotaxis protein [Planktothrix sp. FACHB-1355]|uniref:Methyl-accepting chemotaxis protein n=1 Tax=Aerosakkonema funiforme FACHB-1375 TaxID=2949571 RepID=A0A926VFL9_9CYAN|nr:MULTISPECIES: methyl-accepting chemotaxis protein [Oscillatoriales]MBD2182775.1 methyl-accepting chemotaxis protein [Aerosakkonema funiforme FACHB-1375]MBD3558789.1 methyl-accepting chemotaxis protein [Planktothrix sp. FACHB-1355]
MKSSNVKWHKSLNTQTLIGVGAIAVGLIASLILAIEIEGKKLVFAESSRLIEQTGDNAVSDLENRSREIAALARSIGATAEELPKSEIVFKQVLPKVIDFQGDLAVAGGGFWPEPYAFDSKVERRSFFWGRESNNSLKYYDDYNKSGYHNTDWYVVAKYLEPGRCFWSRSYVDPYSNEPMVTCTVATQDNRKFSGVATIDLKLGGLQAFTESWQRKTGGYIFIVDRDNKFITFPQLSLVKKIETDSSGKSTQEFIQASEFAVKQPSFEPIARALEAINQKILRQAQQMPKYSKETAAKLDEQSDQIDRQQAELMAAVLADPLKQEQQQNQRFQEFEIKNDWLLQEKSTVYIFHVPSSYWKVVIVKPMSESTLVASRMAYLLISRSALIVVIAAFLGLVSVRYLLIKPVQSLNKVARDIELNASQIDPSKWQNILPLNRSDEVGQLANSFNDMIGQLKTSFDKLNEVIMQANQVGMKVTSSTMQITTAGKQLESTVVQQAVSTNEVKATASEIAATNGVLAKTMEDITQKAQATAASASNSQASLMEMADGMYQLATATTAISSRLAIMNEKANNINSVVTKISKVADRINLISLNAGIEAEKAGEYGVGFTVVAREVKRLADNTAVASQEIEEMIEDIQLSVSKGVEEMDKFSQQVSRYVKQVERISGEIAAVIFEVQSLTPQFEKVSHNMEGQFKGAQQISNAISHLSEASQQTVASLQQTNLVLEQLNDTAFVLQSIISMKVNS